MSLLQNIASSVTEACRKNADIEKTARFELSNSQGTENIETLTEMMRFT